MTLVARPRPFAMTSVLYAPDEADTVRLLLEAIAPDQNLAFLLFEDERVTEPDRASARARTTGASQLRRDVGGHRTAVEPNAVYFVSRGQVTGLQDGMLRYTADPERAGNIESFFFALAVDQGRNGCIIVFAGARPAITADARGLAAVADAGGLVLVQDAPAGAFRRIMPASTTTYALVAAVQPEELATVLLEHAEPLVAEHRPPATSARYGEVEAILPELCKALRKHTRHDFAQYKSSTLVRRTLRRLHMIRCDSATEYLERVTADRGEAQRLFNDLLINVTAFFRDVDAFAALSTTVIPRLFDARPPGEPLRVWIAGCATGEEAYSIAMLLREHADRARDTRPIQLFATDLDESALAVARAGRYPAARLAHVSPERIAAFFTRSGPSFQVTKALREMVMFTRHSVTTDPPFSNIDLVSCRNLLIYLGDELHQRVIPLFHYALRPNGFLFLGPSESLSAHTDLFQPVDLKHRISQRVATPKRAAPLLTRANGMAGLAIGSAAHTESEVLRVMQQMLGEQFTPRGVVVTDEGLVVAASGDLEEFLSVSAGPFVNSVTRLVREGLRVPMRSALRDAVMRGTRTVHHGGSLRNNGVVQRVTITVEPMEGSPETTGLYLVVFQPAGRPLSAQFSSTPQHAQNANALIERLELELATTRDELQRTVQDLEAVNEELKSSNEELLSMNEELQSAIEELESSKDELQATNVQLEDTNADLENLLASTGIPTLFLDDEGNVRRVTPTAGRIYNLQAEDVGRPLAHFTHKALAMPAMPPSAQVHATRGAIEHEIELQDGSWYVRRVLPYVTPAGAHEGIVMTFTDITERRRYEDEIRERESRLRDVIDSMFAFVAVADIDGTLLEVNRGPLEIGGLTREETIGRAFWDCAWWTHDDVVRERLREAFTRAVAGEAVRYDEVVRVAGDGRLTIDFMLQPVFRDGVLQFVIPSGVDVTHRVNTERALRQQRDLTATITDNATTAILLLDGTGRCTYANPASETMTGYRVDELVGSVLHDRIHHHRSDGSEFEAADCAIRNALASGIDMREHADTFLRKDGSFFPVVCNARAVGSSGLVLEVRDVTGERMKGEALRRRTRELQTLADNSPDILTRFDAGCRHVFVNSAVERATGMVAAEFIGRTNRELGMPEAQCDVWEAAIRQVFETGETSTVDFEFDTPQGRRVYAGRFVPELDDDGSVQFALGVTRDRTAERDAEMALQEANRRKDVFLATLAHELRNPLAPVRNGLEILRLASNGDDRTAAIREIMERQIVNMSRLIDDLLDISRISLGKVELQRSVVSLASIFDGALEVSRPAITMARHTISVRLPDEPVLLDADATRLAQVVGNLLQNAAKYTPDGGEITLEAAPDAGHVMIRVSDNGIGIERSMLSHVFEMFTQVEHPRAKSQGGLGIGLALVRQLVEMHGGWVRAESEGPDTGSTFTVRLPLASAAASGRPSTIVPAWDNAPPGRRTVLVVDDNADAARSLETILTMMGHDACCAFTGAQAIELLESIEPDVVILDIGLPDTSGYELATHIRGELGMTGVLLVALTGWGSEEHRRRSVEAGFDFHLTKPADSAIIRRIMSRALTR